MNALKKENGKKKYVWILGIVIAAVLIVTGGVALAMDYVNGAEKVSGKDAYAKPTEAEQKKILEEAEGKFAEIREFLEEDYFSKQKGYLDEELVTLYYLDPEKKLGYAEYYLQRGTDGGEEKYFRIIATYELVSKDAGPQLKDADAQEINEEAFRQARDLSEKVILIK